MIRCPLNDERREVLEQIDAVHKVYPNPAS